MISTIPARLRRHAAELDAIAREIARLVPESADRNDNILAASNAAYAAKSRANDAATLIEWAIREATEGGER